MRNEETLTLLAPTTSGRMVDKAPKGRKNLKKNEELFYEPTRSKVLTSHYASATKATDD